MSRIEIIGQKLGNIPWQEKPQGYEGVVWRHSENPMTSWNPTKKTARIYNSAVVPYDNGYVGIFRADHKNGTAMLHFGKSNDGLKSDISDEENNGRMKTEDCFSRYMHMLPAWSR